MTSANFILASLRHHRRMHVAVGLGVAVATAVLTGALLVGDSVRGSLRDLTLQRLGRIDSALVTGHFFREALAAEVEGEPAILISGTLRPFGASSGGRRASQISVIGCRDEFWTFGRGGPVGPMAERTVALTKAIAEELDVQVNDQLLLRLPYSGEIPADSALGKKSSKIPDIRLTVSNILDPEGLARFGLFPSQQFPRNAFVAINTLQNELGKAGQVNAILVAGEVKESAFKPQLVDYGLRVEAVEMPAKYVSVSSDQLVLPDAVVTAAKKAFAASEMQPVVTYLANSLVVGSGAEERRIPYSTITGVDSVAEIGPLLDGEEKPIRLANDEIALSRWAADDLGAKIGDSVTVNYYEPESTHGVLREHNPLLQLRLAHIVELEQDGPPTAAADPHLTPELPGVTDQDSISDWDLPFELVETIRQQDEDYWDQYRTTPKAFVSLATATRLWGSRWGTISLIRVPGLGREGVSAKMAAELKPADLGMTFLPVKQLGLAASSGTTPFDALFLGFSFFLIAAAVMLISLLFKLGVEQRAKELGMLGAMGLRSRKVAWLLSSEGLVVAAIGAAAGLALGVLYAWLIITGLRTWWVAAVSTPFLTLHVTPRSLIIGWLVGVAVSWLTIRWSIRQLARLPLGRLLAGTTEAPATAYDIRMPSAWPRVREALVALSVALCVVGYLLRGESQAGIFFTSGAAVLTLLLGEVRYQLRRLSRSKPSYRSLTLAKLSALNTARHPGRSTLTIGLVATATFLITAISAFRLDTGVEGTGGFAFTATSDQPIYFDLDTPAGRTELGFADRDQELLGDWKTYSVRVTDGEDASCLNLYRPTQPRVLGLPQSFIERGGFGWADSAPIAGEENANAWTLLDGTHGNDENGRPIVPVVLDMSTAVYSLHLSGVGARLVIRDAADRPVTLQVVGLLKNSVLQGNLLVSEANFLQLFPDVGGYRFFLIEPGKEASVADANAVARVLESTLSADGFDAVDAHEQLAGFLAVQNTYLSTFQSLGALGLLLGTVGLAVVQLRSVLERRGELALMRAGGFPARRLVEMVLSENAVLLLGGLVVGLMAAAVALLPQWALQGASVPWLTLAGLLGTIAVVGLAAGWLATRSALEAPIVAALRGE